jgi:hypothetical protein
VHIGKAADGSACTCAGKSSCLAFCCAAGSERQRQDHSHNTDDAYEPFSVFHFNLLCIWLEFAPQKKCVVMSHHLYSFYFIRKP